VWAPLMQYGTTWTLKWPLSPRFFFITEPRVLEHVLKTNFTGYEKGPYFHENLVDLLGDGIFNSDGDKWHVQRKLAAHMFSRCALGSTPLQDMTNSFPSAKGPTLLQSLQTPQSSPSVPMLRGRCCDALSARIVSRCTCAGASSRRT